MTDPYLIDHIIEIKESVSRIETKVNGMTNHDERITKLEHKSIFQSGVIATVSSIFTLIGAKFFQ